MKGPLTTGRGTGRRTSLCLQLLAAAAFGGGDTAEYPENGMIPRLACSVPTLGGDAGRGVSFMWRGGSCGGAGGGGGWWSSTSDFQVYTPTRENRLNTKSARFDSLSRSEL